MIIAFFGGTMLGLLFFGGLYLTVDRLTISKYPALMMLGSTVLRMIALLAGVYLLMGNEFRQAAATLVGIVFAKFSMVFFVKQRQLRDRKE